MKPKHTRQADGVPVGWRDILDRWSLVDVDLSDAGYDLHDPAIVRPWPWWRDRIWGLLDGDTRLSRALLPAAAPTPIKR